MRRLSFLLMAVLCLLVTSPAMANDFAPYHPNHSDSEQPVKPRHRWVGIQFDLGVPDGAAFGLVFRPYVDWLRLHVSGTYNGLSGGVRGGLTLDPINFPMAPTLTVEGGHSFEGKFPGITNMPAFGYDYVNLHLGLEFGKRDVWRFFFQGGPTWMHVTSSDFQTGSGSGSGSGSTTTGNPTMSGWVCPSLKFGFTVYF